MDSDSYSGTCYPALNPKEEEHLRHLLGPDYFKREFKDEQIQCVLSRLLPSMKQRLKMKEILPLLRQKPVLIDTEIHHIENSQPTEQAILLVEYLMNKGIIGIEMLYLCLLESSEQANGVPGHYQLAGELKEIVQVEYGICASSGLTAVSSTHLQQQSLDTLVERLYNIPLDPETAKIFTANLGLSSSDFRTPPTSFHAICQCWLSQGNAPADLDQLVEALVKTRGLGRHTSCLCSPVVSASAASLEVRNFLLSLGERWVELAGFLGFSGEEVGAITEAHASSTEHQVLEFLKLWQFPECGQRMLPLMHKLKNMAGIVELRDRRRRLTDRPGNCITSRVPDGKDTWEYKTLFTNQAKLADQLADMPGIALRLSDELYASKIIGKAVRDAANIHGPDVTEIMRVQPILTAMLAKIELNPKRYHELRDAMLVPNVGVDSEVVDRFVPEKVQAELGISVSSDLTAVSSTHQQQQSLQTQMKKPFQIPVHVGLTDQPIQAQAMSGATIINNTKIVNNLVTIFPPFHPYHCTRTAPSCYQFQSLPRKRSSSEISTAKLLGFSSESETETDTVSVATTEDSVFSRCISPVSMTGHERGVDHEYSASDSDQEKLMLHTVTSSDSERLQICMTSHYQQRPPEPLTIQMLPTVTGNDLDGLQEYIAPHYQQGPPEPPATQPLIERSTHDRLSSPSDNAPIQPAPTSDDQPTEDNRQKQRQLSKNKQMVQTVTSSDSEGRQEYMASHYRQGPPEPPTTLQQPSMERSTHDRLSSPSYKKIRAPIKPTTTSDDQPTMDNEQKQRQLSKNKQMLQTVTSSESEGLQENTTPHNQQGPPELPTTQSFIERSTHDQLSFPSDEKICGPEPTSGDLPTEDKKQMFMEEIENIPPIKYSNKDNHRRLNKALYGAAYLLGKNKPMEFYNEQIVPLSVIKKTFCKSLTSSDEDMPQKILVTDEHSHFMLQLRFRHLQAENRSLIEENRRLRQSQRYPMQENRSQFHETLGSTKVSSRNRPSRILQPGFSKRAPGATSGPMRLRRGHPSKIPVPLHTCPSPSSLQSTTTEESSITSLDGMSRFVPSVQATTRLKTEGRPRIVPSTCSSPPSLQSGAARGSVRRSELVQSIQETQGLYVLCLYSPVKQMMIPILAVSISVSRESTQRLCQKLVCDYDGHQFALERRRVRFETTTATVDIISSPDGYEVIPKQTPTEITKEEVDLEGADDFPVYIIFQIERQWSTSVDQHSVHVRLGVNGLDRPYEYEPVLVMTSSLPSAVQPQEIWINLIVQHLHHKWYELGINLRLNVRELRSIERKHSDDIGRCRSVIKKWAHKNGTLNDAAALRRLIEVVRNTDESDDFADLLEVTAVRLNLR